MRECNAASGCPAVFLLAVVLKTLSFSIFFEGASFSTKNFLIFVQEHYEFMISLLLVISVESYELPN